jgi:YVTN family beta-propeller protein
MSVRRLFRLWFPDLGTLILSGVVLFLSVQCMPTARPSQIASHPLYRSPYLLAASEDGKVAYVSDRTARCIVQIGKKGTDTDFADKIGVSPLFSKLAEWPVPGEPTGVAITADGKRLFVALCDTGEVAVLDTAGGHVQARIATGVRPEGLTLGKKTGRLYVCNRGEGSVSVIDARSLTQVGRVAVIREPFFSALSPDETRLVVSNALPLGAATDEHLAAAVSVIDTAKLQTIATVPLPGGSTNLRGICVDPTGAWAYCVHALGRFNLPATQLERGWMNTSAMSIIDLRANKLYATVLLDSINEGAADPCSVALSPAGDFLYVALAGTSQVQRVDVKTLHKLLAGDLTPEVSGNVGQANTNVWLQIKKDPAARADLSYDLMAMDLAGLLRRVPSGGTGPRGLALCGKTLLAANYFSGDIQSFDAATLRPLTQISVGSGPPEGLARRGERMFHDARLCFQKWQSCATCHPDGRSDGLRWDLLNDGIGNPKRTRSMVRAFDVHPMMSMGVRADAGSAVRAGFKFILFSEPPEEVPQAVDAYLKNLRPEPSPLLVKGRLSDAARRGKAVFEGKAQCESCHSGAIHTDMQSYSVVDLAEGDAKDSRFYTPRLVELYRGGPFLHDGRAATVKDVLTTFNKNDRHGRTSNLTPAELDNLIAFLLSL